jgi:hypothetical protein
VSRRIFPWLLAVDGALLVIVSCLLWTRGAYDLSAFGVAVGVALIAAGLIAYQIPTGGAS